MLGIEDNTTQQTLLRERNLTLEKTIDICRAAENATLQGKMFRAETVNRVAAPKTKESAKPVNMRQIRCKYCGRQHPKQRQQCPAFGQSCRQCGKMNHFALLSNAQTRKQLEHLYEMLAILKITQIQSHLKYL